MYLSPIVIVCPAFVILVSITLPSISVINNFTGSFRSLLFTVILKFVLLGFGIAITFRSSLAGIVSVALSTSPGFAVIPEPEQFVHGISADGLRTLILPLFNCCH